MKVPIPVAMRIEALIDAALKMRDNKKDHGLNPKVYRGATDVPACPEDVTAVITAAEACMVDY